MITEINRIKHSPVFKREKAFFDKYKTVFTTQLTHYLTKTKTNSCECCMLYAQNIAENFYDSIFNPDKVCFNRHLCWLTNASRDTVLFLCSLMNAMTKEFIQKQKLHPNQQTIEFMTVLESLQDNFFTALSEQDKITFDVSPDLPKDEGIRYLHNMYKLGREMRFLVYTRFGTSASKILVQQLGESSAVIKISDEQLTMLSSQSSSFIIKENADEKNFNLEAKILCAKDNTATIEKITELETCPLLSRKFPRAAFIHTSLVHIANEVEYITGNMLDISEGGMGIMSSTKSRFEKGQNIVAFVSYEDEKSGFKFSFEANGIITSIIGKENAFRYGIQLDLNEEEKDIVRNLVNRIKETREDKRDIQL